MNEEMNEEMKNFNEATQATEDMFITQQEETQNIETDNNIQETEESPQVEEISDTTENAIRTAEVAAQLANEKDANLQRALEELNILKAQNGELQQTISQMSEQQKSTIVEEALQIPVLDIGSLAFDDDETIKNKQQQYAMQMADYIKGSLMGELNPFVEQAKDGMYQKEKNEVITALSQVPELHGINEMLPQLDRIIANNKALSSEEIPVDEKYITAYAIAKGVNSINTPPPKDPTADELLKMYENNSEFQALVEQKRIDAIKNSQQVPPLSASNGAVNVALNIKEKPQTLEEASKRTREMFGFN